MDIFVVEDASLVLESLLDTLRRQPGITVVGHAGGEDEAVRLILECRPDVVILDLALSPGSGLNVLKRIRAVGMDARVLILSNQSEAAYRERCLEAGASGFFDKTHQLDALLQQLALWHPPLADDESARLKALYRLGVLETAEDEMFDAYAALAARIVGTPTALVTLLDADRQWIKGKVGTSLQQTSRAISFCAHAITGAALLEVEDARADRRFADNPLVVGEPGIRFYAGMPLILPGGEAVGTLCVIDTAPRRLDAAQRRALQVLAASLVAAMELRRRVGHLETEVQRRQDVEVCMMRLATRDPLTGLPNRAMLVDRLVEGIKAAARTGTRLAVLFVDLDQFKVVNDRLGHEFGDVLLQRTAERLTRSLRESDTVARFGGDEFALILPMQGQSDSDAEGVAAKVVSVVRAPLLIGDHPVQVGCSIGIAHFPDQGTSEAMLLRHADLAMYEAKAAGGNCWRVFSERMRTEAQERVVLEADLRESLEEQAFELHYQPQLSLANGTLTGVEALVRWNHPRLGQLSPGSFITLAEDTGLIWLLGLQVLDMALGQMADWEGQGLSVPRIAVNVSPRQLRETLVDDVAALLQRYGVAPSRLEIELTENALTSDGPAVIALIHRLRDLGISIAIDDFGAGYTSLGLLRRLPISTLKIDRSFLNDLPDSGKDLALIRAMITMARALGLRTIAEGVEVREQHVELRAVECEEGQGYLYARPMAAAQMESWLHETGGRIPMKVPGPPFSSP